MKNKFLLTIGLLAISLSACGGNNNNSGSNNNSGNNNKEGDYSKLSIITPSGAPALAFYGFATSDQFSVNTEPTNIVAMMNAGQKDVIVLPTNAGVSAIVNKQAPYKIAATVTFGNFFIGSLNNDDNEVMDENDTILLFQKGNVPDKLFHYVYGNKFDKNIHYVSTVNDIAVAVRDGKFTDEQGEFVPNYVLTAEPSLTVMSKTYEHGKISFYASIQDEYRKKTNYSEIFQASVFIKNDVKEEDGQALLSKLKTDIETILDKPSELEEGMNKVDAPKDLFGVDPVVAAGVLRGDNGMGLGYKYAKDSKESIDKFLGLFNIAETNEEIYF